MSMLLGATPNSRSRQLVEHRPTTYGEAGLYFPGHEGQDDVTPIPSAISHYLVLPSSGIDAPSSVPSRRPSTRRHDPNYIPRPRNAFIFFRSAYISSLRASGEVQQNELSKQAGDLWQSMSPKERKPFSELAATEKEEHYAKFPDYVYSPSVKAGAKSAGSQKVTGVRKSLEKKRKASIASEYIASRTASPPATPALLALWNHISEQLPSFEREPPSPFHAHLDHITDQFAYQQYTHDFIPASIPTLPYASSSFNQGLNNMDPGMPPVSFSNLLAYPHLPAPSPLLCDNPYLSADHLALLNYTFPDGGLEGDALIQQYMNDLAKQSEFTTTYPDLYAEYQHENVVYR